jgi:hypothetical protein
MTGRLLRFTPSKAINARMPPSPSLSMRMAKPAYFTEVMTINVQTSSEITPKMVCGLSPPVMSSTVLKVYSGLVPISPNTTPRAPMPSSADRFKGFVAVSVMACAAHPHDGPAV